MGIVVDMFSKFCLESKERVDIGHWGSLRVSDENIDEKLFSILSNDGKKVEWWWVLSYGIFSWVITSIIPSSVKKYVLKGSNIEIGSKHDK